ncbi:MAG TPA: HAMP domain-containing sensor histidine kinase [Azospirillaceae bacterium]|nr:HAMP domain-containing sensor histidine kinase [Azospirillaceae bacterium]
MTAHVLAWARVCSTPRIRVRLLLLGLLILGTAGAAVGTYLVGLGQLDQTTAALERLRSLDEAVDELAHEVNEIRHAQHHFMVWFDPIDAGRYHRAREEAGRLLDRIVTELGSSGGVAVTKRLRTNIERHAQGFNRFVDLVATRGSKEDEGLQGAFRHAAHLVEARLSAMNDADRLTIALLMMRRHEKDFMLRRDEAHLERFQERRNEILAMLPSTGLDAAEARTIATHMDSYAAAFEAFAAVEKHRVLLGAEIAKLADEIEADLRVLDSVQTTRFEAAEQAYAKGRGDIRRAILIAILLVLAVSAALGTAIAWGLAQLVREAQETNQAKSRFLAVVTHELRTPLNVVVGFAEMIEEEASGPLGTPEYRDWAKEIRAGGQRLLAMVNDALEFAQLDAGMANAACEQVDVGMVIKASLRNLGGRALERAQTLEGEDGIEPGLLVQADERMLRRLLTCLLDNAVKFTPQGGTVRVGAVRLPGGKVEVTVRDNGVGIAPELLDRVVEPLFQADGALARGYEGSGLGLAIAQRLVALQKGSMTIESEPGVGTTVKVRLPTA